MKIHPSKADPTADGPTVPPPAAAGGEPRVIKKYPNRRLYDTEESRYITLAEVRKLVVDGVEFRVLDQQTQADLTNAILLQVIAEQEAQGGDPLLSRELLTHLIRAYGGQMQGLAGKYLEQSMQLFMAQQRDLRERLRGAVGHDPVELALGLAQRNYERLRSLQDEVFKRFVAGKRDQG
jgi:polyhydroxyalkanoate synthesis repressor PhaR